jgi:DNA-binding CsgD family transcriptional regulator
VVSDNQLIGRERELDAIDRFLSSTATWPAALVLAGPAGIGKTSVWRAAIESARSRGALVLESRAIERELEEPYAALGDLLDPHADQLASLPLPQRRALEVALLLTDPGPQPPGHRAMGLGFAGVLRTLAAERPVLIAIDDVQWLDGESMAVLSFTLRRLPRVAVGVILTLRGMSEGDDPLEVGRLADWQYDVMDLGPLSLGAMHALVRNVMGMRLSRPAIRRVHELSRGNPYHARELARIMADAPPSRNPWELPLPLDLRATLASRLARLRPSSRAVLAAAALCSRPTLDVLRAAVGSRAAAELQAAVVQGIVELDGDAISFTHPLLASVLLDELDDGRRRILHRRLAAVIGDDAERAGHLGLAAKRPSMPVVGALESAARREAARGAPAAAAGLLELAASLVTKGNRQQGQTDLLEAARLYSMAGAIESARRIAAAVLAERPLPDLASEGRLILAELKPHPTATLRAAERVLADTSASPTARSKAAELASVARFVTGDVRGALELSREALRFAGQSSDPRAIAVAGAWLALLETWSGSSRPGLLAKALEAAAESRTYLSYLEDPRAVRGLQRMYLDEVEEARRDLVAVLAAARARGDDNAASGVLLHLAELECRTGDFATALTRAQESVDLSDQIGSEQGRGAGLYALALALTHLGRVDEARAAIDEGIEVVTRLSDWVFAMQLRSVRGFLELSLGNLENAAAELRELPRALLAHGIREPSVFPVWPNAIEALLGTGELDDADDLVAAYAALADEFHCPWAIASAARSAGLLAASRGDLVAAEADLTRALIAHERVRSRFERARTELALGSVLRRAKRRREARDVLVQAEAAFRGMGAQLWATRTTAEAARIGGRRPGGPGMSATEEQVARLVAAGHTNREVAAALFVTERTVESNLSNIYAKLGVRSRTELTRVVLMGADPDSR